MNMNIMSAIHREIQIANEEKQELERRFRDVQMLSDGLEGLHQRIEKLDAKIAGLRRAHELAAVWTD